MTQTTANPQQDTNTAQPQQAAKAESCCHGRRYLSAVDIIENPHDYVVMADVPGATPNDVDVTYEQGELTIHAHVNHRQHGADTRMLLREYGVGDFVRSFSIGEAVNPTSIEAKLTNGVLTVRLPKSESAKSRRVSVQGA